MRAFAYIRQSEAREGSVSPDVQADEIARYCESRGYAIVETFADIDLSAYRLPPEKRPELQRMIRAAEDGGCDVIVFYRIDRLARRLEDQYAILASLKEAGVRVDSVGQPWDDTPEGRFMWDLSGALAGLESRRLGKRIRDAHRRMAREGRYHGGLPPFGWRSRPDGTGLVADPDTAPVRRQMHDWYQRGWSLRRIARALNEQGILTSYGHPWNARGVRQALLSPYQVGARATPDGLASGGNVEPILDDETYQRTLALHTARGASGYYARGRTPQALLPGRLVRCGTCGRALSIWHESPGTVTYHCTGPAEGLCAQGVSIRRHLLEDVVVERLLTHLHSLKAPQKPHRVAEPVAPLARDIEALRASLARLATLCAEGELTLDEYRQARDGQRAKLARAERRLEQAAELARRDAERESVAGAADQLRGLTRGAWENMSLEARREITALLIEKIVVSARGVSPRVTVQFRH